MSAIAARARIQLGVADALQTRSSLRWVRLLRELRTNEKADARAEMLAHADQLDGQGDREAADACRSASAFLDPNGYGPDPIGTPGRD